MISTENVTVNNVSAIYRKERLEYILRFRWYIIYSMTIKKVLYLIPNLLRVTCKTIHVIPIIYIFIRFAKKQSITKWVSEEERVTLF